jgi:hypothetical protein
LLPAGSPQPVAHSTRIGTTDAVVAAGATVSDMSSFCERQPKACEVGAQAAAVIGQRAQAGARMVYEFLSDRIARGETGSVTVRKPPVPDAAPVLRGTLKPTDLEPAWQAPPSQGESVPLPRPRTDPRQRA